MKKLQLLLILPFLSSFNLLLTAQSPGTLDPTFGTAGVVTTDFKNTWNTARCVFVQPDGKIVVLGNNNTITDVTALRYTSTGALDNSFSGDGVYSQAAFGFSLSDVEYTELWSGALQPDGKILMTGIVKTFNNGSVIFIIRLQANGAPDSGFGTNGLVKINRINWADPQDQPVSTALLPDGKILLFTATITDKKFTLIWLNANGTVDKTLDITSSVPNIYTLKSMGLAIQPDGKIIAHGASGTHTHYFRFLPDGTPDNTFSGDGELALTGGSAIGDQLHRMALLPDGKIVARHTSFKLVRIKPDGTLDNTFGSGGTAGFTRSIYAVLAQSDGKLLYPSSLSSRAALFRTNADGSLDYPFGGTGAGAAVLDETSGFYNLVQQPDGKVVACGIKDGDFLVARFFVETLTDTREPADFLRDVVIGPNPAYGPLLVRFQLMEEQPLSIQILHLTGQVARVVEQASLFSAGLHTRSLDLSGLSSGRYVLSFRSKTGAHGVPFSIVR